MRVFVLFFALIGLFRPVAAQNRVDPGNLYHRVLAVVPIVGKGTWDDPKRPMFAPLPGQKSPTDRSGIIAYQHQVSDDGTLALVEFIAVDAAALNQILSPTAPNVKAFERGKHTRGEIESEFKKYKKNFSFDTFQPLRVQ
jgi:hypothetical protein